jgi:hypothetical protein
VAHEVSRRHLGVAYLATKQTGYSLGAAHEVSHRHLGVAYLATKQTDCSLGAGLLPNADLARTFGAVIRCEIRDDRAALAAE